MQFARAKTSGGTLLLSIIVLNIVDAFLSVSSSFDLSAVELTELTVPSELQMNDHPAILGRKSPIWGVMFDYFLGSGLFSAGSRMAVCLLFVRVLFKRACTHEFLLGV
jgi:hypothetical protein